MPAISVIVCTCDRVARLQCALRCLLHQTIDWADYEIIVVDNSTKEETSDLVSSEFRDYSCVRYVKEGRQDLCAARNLGMVESGGKHLAFLDDDAVPSPQWLEVLLSGFRSIAPEPACIVGRVRPIWEAECPAWLHERLRHLLTILDISGAAPEPLNEGQYGCGTNMAFVKEELLGIGGFPARLSRRGKGLMGNDDTYVQERLRRLGHSCYYHPEAVVWHPVHAARLRQGWFLRRMFQHGSSKAIEQILLGDITDEQRIARAAYLLREAISVRRIKQLLLPVRDPERFREKALAFAELGYVLGMWSDCSAEVRPLSALAGNSPRPPAPRIPRRPVERQSSEPPER